ncbi:MAG: hypothetical protein K9M07_07225 [Simkaniaceae bacterium]|nr:hypothetical protein [Simkaniaceae bacterium]
MSRFFFLFALLFPLLGYSLTLMEKLQNAHQGDYVVTLMSKNYSLISIHTKTDDSIIFEEISVPVSSMEKAPDWKNYVLQKAPKAISWILYEIDLKTGKMIESYNVLGGYFLDLSSFDSVLAKLMHLTLETVKESERRRIGVSSSLSGFDTRKIWNPPLVFERKKEKSPQFSVYHATWPEDATILSGKTVELYFDRQRSHFPFPMWMQIKDASDTSFKVPSVDAGHSMPTTMTNMPRRLPYFYDKVIQSKETIIIKISIPSYYKGLNLHFVSYVPKQEQPIHINIDPILGSDPESVEFHIPRSFIEQHISLDQPYHLMLTINSHPSVSVESAKSYRFKKLKNLSPE